MWVWHHSVKTKLLNGYLYLYINWIINFGLNKNSLKSLREFLFDYHVNGIKRLECKVQLRTVCKIDYNGLCFVTRCLNDKNIVFDPASSPAPVYIRIKCLHILIAWS
jgi:hypothetical protein